MGVANRGVKIRKKLIAKVEISAADIFDLGVMQILGSRQKLGIVLNRTNVTAIPSPRQAKHPGAPMRAKQGTEGAELKPPNVELGGKLLGGEEAAGVGTPIWDAAKGRVESCG